jgi:hypothetical protein
MDILQLLWKISKMMDMNVLWHDILVLLAERHGGDRPAGSYGQLFNERRERKRGEEGGKGN